MGLETRGNRRDNRAMCGRSAFRSRRCLIPANGYFEWKAAPGRKQPYYIRPKHDELCGFAALYETWQGPEGPVTTCAILTTNANSRLREIYDRMPVIVARADYAQWLAPGVKNPDEIQRVIASCAEPDLVAHPVDPRVNSTRHDDAELIEPVAA